MVAALVRHNEGFNLHIVPVLNSLPQQFPQGDHCPFSGVGKAWEVGTFLILEEVSTEIPQVQVIGGHGHLHRALAEYNDPACKNVHYDKDSRVVAVSVPDTMLREKERAMDGQSNRLLASLFAAGTRSQLEPQFKIVELTQGQVLAEPLEPIRHVYFPYSGIISFLVPLTNGSLVQTGVVGQDGAVGALQALDGKVSPNKIVVQMPGRAAVIDADQFSKIAQAAPGARSLILSHEECFLAEVQQSAACNAVHPVRQRLSRWLLRMNDLMSGRNIAVTQEILSNMLGVQRSSVTVAAASLQKVGAIRYRRGHIQILDIELLRESSCECYAAVRRSYDRIVRA